MDSRIWWKQPLRIIQNNLQVKDAPLMNPERIACETQEMSANTLVINVGGIYAWYPTKVKYHHVNEYLPKDYDLLAKLIDECHKRNIRVIARFDFSKTDDYVSQERPDWFIRKADGTRVAYGQERPGNWSILYNTCINSGYRNEELAVPVIEEVLNNYDIDGIFLNAPGYEYCTCDNCRKKYFKLYGKALPIEAAGMLGEATYGHQKTPDSVEKSFPGICYRDSINNLYRAIKDKRPEVPLILYFSIYNENINDRLLTADMLCIEAQDVLSRGWDNSIPPIWYPTMIMKVGRTQPEENPKPCGIIHSCPGMDWRHTGLPQAEYQPWLRMIAAAGGSIWHSITGFNQTVTDKRILKAVSDVNSDITKVETDMDGAIDYANVLLLWNNQKTHGWAQLLVTTQTQFSVCADYQITDNLLAKYAVVIVPDGFPMTESIVEMLRRYAENGGNLVIEGTTSEQLEPFADIIGIDNRIQTSEPLTACYWQFEEAGRVLQNDLENTPIIVHRGQMAYTRALNGTSVFATLIPPFAPLNSVGAPPERASMLVKHTDIPLCTERVCGKGKVVMIAYQLSQIADSYRLADLFTVWSNMVDHLLGKARILKMKTASGIVANSFISGDKVLIHMVNMIGQRPLINNVPYVDFSFRIALPKDKNAVEVEGVLSDAEFSWSKEDNAVVVNVRKLNLWEMFRITVE